MTADSPGDPLRHCWFPVAAATAVQDGPARATLLGEDLVLWRTPEGVAAFTDLCIHRGARLSQGWVDGGSLVCPYHGWSYARDGACTRIPSIPPEQGIPRRARAAAHACCERYGLIFVSMDEPRGALPAFPEFDDPAYRTIFLSRTWQASAARSTENFIDLAHLPWAHEGILGSRENPLTPVVQVQAGESELYFELQTPCQDRLDPSVVSYNRLSHRVLIPFSVYYDNLTPPDERIAILFMVTPTAEHESTRFMLVARNYALAPERDADFHRYSELVWEQDRPIVEGQRPERLPLDLSEELHIRGADDVQVVYRRKLREFGLPDV